MLAEDERAQRSAVTLLGDPQPGPVRPRVHVRDRTRPRRPRLDAPLAGLAAGDEPCDGLVEQREHQRSVDGRPLRIRTVATTGHGIVRRRS
jgi:hypothetical protein